MTVKNTEGVKVSWGRMSGIIWFAVSRDVMSDVTLMVWWGEEECGAREVQIDVIRGGRTVCGPWMSVNEIRLQLGIPL